MSVQQECALSSDILHLGGMEAPIPDLRLSDFLSDWRNETEGSPHVDTRSLTLRGLPTGSTYEDVFESSEVVTYEGCTEEWAELLSEALYAVGGAELGRAMLVFLKPGGEIHPHSDEGSYCQERTRYHIPIMTNQDCTNTFGGTTEHLERGIMYQVDNDRVHSAINNGDTPRVHLIFDIKGF